MMALIISQLQMGLDETFEIAHSIVNKDASSSVILFCVCLDIVISIVSAIVVFGFQRRLKEFEVTVDRKKMINQSAIDVETKIYKELNNLSLIDSKESHVLLEKVVGLQTYINENKLFLRRKLILITNEIIDYYSGLCTDFRRKDYSKETKLLEKYKKVFNE